MCQFFIIDKDDEGGRFYCHLGHIVKAQTTSLILRRLHLCGGAGQDLVDDTGGDPHGMITHDQIDLVKELDQPLPGHGRHEHQLRIRHEGQLGTNILPELVHGTVVLLHQIPFVDYHDHTLAAVMGYAGDLGILIRYALGGVDHQNSDIAALHGSHGTDDGIPFDLILDLALPTKACGVDHHVFRFIVLNHGVYRIPGSSGDIGYDEPFLSQQLVDHGRLAYIRLSDDGNLRPVILFLIRLGLREEGNHLIQQVTEAQLGGSRYRMGITESQIIELVDIRHVFIKIIYLIYTEKDGFP